MNTVLFRGFFFDAIQIPRKSLRFEIVALSRTVRRVPEKNGGKKELTNKYKLNALLGLLEKGDFKCSSKCMNQFEFDIQFFYSFKNRLFLYWLICVPPFNRIRTQATTTIITTQKNISIIINKYTNSQFEVIGSLYKFSSL